MTCECEQSFFKLKEHPPNLNVGKKNPDNGKAVLNHKS